MPSKVARRSFLHFLADHNPFYLLSAASMLLACLLLSNTMTWSPIKVRQLLMLIVTLNVYEILLVALGLYLLVRRNLRRDGVMLLTLEALFLVDVGFLNSELYQADFRVGLYANLMLLALAVAKLFVIFRVLQWPVLSPTFALLMAQMSTLVLLPGWFKYVSEQRAGQLPELTLYGAWWIAAALMAALAVTQRWSPSVRDAATSGLSLVGIFVALPVVSLIAHLGTSHWVYDAPFRAPDASPLLLGLATILIGVPATTFAPRRDVRLVTAGLLVAAVCTSLPSAPSLAFQFAGQSITPATVTAAAAYVTLVYCFFLRHVPIFALIGVAGGATYLFGPSIETIGAGLGRVVRWTLETARSLVPKTQSQWGVVALIGAFALLLIGALLSLLKGRPHDQAPPTDGPGTTPPADDAPPVTPESTNPAIVPQVS